MDETLRQIGELLLGSVPTIIFFLVLYGLYVALVHKPLSRILAERYSRTQGAIEKSRADITLAESRTAEYEHKLRDARLALFKAVEDNGRLAGHARRQYFKRVIQVVTRGQRDNGHGGEHDNP